MIFVYAAVKYAAYSAWCYFGLRLLQPTLVSLKKSLALGAVRWLLGLFFGVVIFFAVDTDQSRAFFDYLVIYSPVRFLEWGLIGWMIVGRQWSKPVAFKFLFWVVLGIGLSFATDFTSPEMVGEGRFCIGRCLC